MIEECSLAAASDISLSRPGISQRKGVCIPGEKHQGGQQSGAEQEQGPDCPPFQQHLCGSRLLGAGSSIAKQQEPGGLNPIS